MANFMGPMAPPQAAPNAPPQLDIRTNPSQRAQFKEFMQGMNRPVMPPTTAPIAPMLPAPMSSPMDQIDIFAPVPMANGGGVGSYFEDIPTASDPAMAGGTTNLIDASNNSIVSEDDEAFASRVAGPIMEKLSLGQDLYNVNASYNDPTRPMFGMADLFAPGAPFADTIAQPPASAPSALENAMNFAGGIMRGVQAPGPMGGTFSVRPVVQQRGLDDSLGIMANFSLPFKDGGPVRMQDGGRLAGGTTNLIDDSRPSSPSESDSFGDPFDRPADAPQVFSTFDPDPDQGNNESDSDPISDAVAAVISAELKGQKRDRQIREANPVDLTFDAPRIDTSDRIVGGAGQFSDDQQKDDFQRIDDVISAVSSVRDPFDRPSSLLGDPFDRSFLRGDTSSAELLATLDPVTQARVMNPPADSIVEPFVGDEMASDSSARPSGPPPADIPGASPMTDLLAGEPGTSGGGDDSLSMAVGRMLATPVTFKTDRGNVTGTALDDLNRRMGEDRSRVNEADGGFMGLGKLTADVLSGIGRDKATDIFTNIEAGRPGVIDARTGQITGYIGDNALGFGKSYTGRGGFDPFAPGADATFDPSRNAYVVNRQQPNQDEGERQSSQPTTPLPTTDPADTTPPPLMITRPPFTGLPPSMPDPTNVLVPSTRPSVPVTVPSILPTQGTAPTFLPQSFLDLLASFNRPAPRAMQDGGAVLDKAADDFLEALKVA